MAVLEKMHRKHIPFLPSDPEHRAAYWRLRTTGKQDSELRFILEEGFHSIMTMMQCKIADHYSKPAEPLPAAVPSLPAVFRKQGARK